MSYDKWCALPDKPNTEWVSGIAVVTPPAAPRHMAVALNIATMLQRDLPGLRTYMEVGMRLGDDTVRIPDVTVLENKPEGVLVCEVPVLVVEVLTPSTRSEDTVRKSTEYAAAGIGQYWIVDPDLHALDAFANADPGLDLVLHLDADHPTGTIEVLDQGTISLDLTTLLTD